MRTFLEKTKRPLLALALTLGIGAGYASAVEYYATSACCPVEPVVCDSCGSSGLSRTSLPGSYSNELGIPLTAVV